MTNPLLAQEEDRYAEIREALIARRGEPIANLLMMAADTTWTIRTINFLLRQVPELTEKGAEAATKPLADNTSILFYSLLSVEATEAGMEVTEELAAEWMQEIHTLCTHLGETEAKLFRAMNGESGERP